jgi:hypothetical protein
MAGLTTARRGGSCSLLWMAALAGVLVACAAKDDAPEDTVASVPSFSWDEVAGMPRGPRPYFSFFVTTERGLLSLPAGRWSPAPDPVTGFGGNLGGLRGADEICTMLAQHSNPGDTKLWHAFLSSTGELEGERVDAIDRIGKGPWYDFRGYKLADDLPGLLPREAKEGRPRGADPRLADMFTGENGEDIGGAGVDNHDTLTGSNLEGRLFDDGVGGSIATCADWTSLDIRGQPGGIMATGGQVPVGHSWPRSNIQGRHWISEHTVNGCERGGRTNGGTAAPQNDFRVGGAGGYGGFYCFALNALPFTAPAAAR